MKHLTLSPSKDYVNLYYYLKDMGFSEAIISLLRKSSQSLKIDGATATTRSKIKAGQKLEVSFIEQASSQIKSSNLPLDILYEDEDFLIINKPAGLPSIPSKRHYQNNIANAVARYMQKYAEPFVYRVLGRLDKDTSGVLIVAKNPLAASLTTFQKTYIALCHGNFNQKSFQIEKPISTIVENNINKQKRVISADGKPATTKVKVLQEKEGVSLIELKLSQGRTHQIRVHLSSIDHPLLGDKLYGFQDDAPRTMLHCAKVELSPPFSAPKIIVSAPLPKDFEELC